MAEGEQSVQGQDDGPSLLKREVAVELILHDGTHLPGSVYVAEGVALHTLFDALPDFFHLHCDTSDYYLINKAYVAVCKIPQGAG